MERSSWRIPGTTVSSGLTRIDGSGESIGVKGLMKERVRIAMVGAGRLANSVHYPSLASFPDVDIVAVADIDNAALTSTAERYGVAGRYSDYQRMVSEMKPDGVFVIGQPHLMYDIWVWCLQQGLPLAIEKPLGLSMHQARILTHLAETAGVVTQVGFQRRAAPILMSLRERVRASGPITQAMVQFYKPGPEPMIGARDRMMDDCVHAIDTVRWLCGDGLGTQSGAEVVAVESRCRRIGTPDINWVHASLTFDNGSQGIVLCNWASGRRIFRIEMHAPGACAEGDQEGVMHYFDATTAAREGVRYEAQAVSGSDRIIDARGFLAKDREFIDSLLTGRHLTSSPFRDAIKTMDVAERILAQALLATG